MLDFEWRKNWAHVTDGVNIIYIQNDWAYNGYTINSVHKPSKKVGTGYQLISQISKHEAENNLIRLMSFSYPGWATESDRKETIKYTTIEEFLNYEKRFHKDAHWIEFNINKI